MGIDTDFDELGMSHHDNLDERNARQIAALLRHGRAMQESVNSMNSTVQQLSGLVAILSDEVGVLKTQMASAIKITEQVEDGITFGRVFTYIIGWTVKAVGILAITVSALWGAWITIQSTPIPPSAGPGP